MEDTEGKISYKRLKKLVSSWLLYSTAELIYCITFLIRDGQQCKKSVLFLSDTITRNLEGKEHLGHSLLLPPSTSQHTY